MRVSLCWDLAAHPRGLHPFNQTVGAPAWQGRDPMASSILTPHNSCDSISQMCRNQRQCSQDHSTLPRGLELILRSPSKGSNSLQRRLLFSSHPQIPLSLKYRAHLRLLEAYYVTQGRKKNNKFLVNEYNEFCGDLSYVAIRIGLI